MLNVKRGQKRKQKSKRKRLNPKVSPAFFLYICSEKNAEHGGNLCTACWVQKGFRFQVVTSLVVPLLHFTCRRGGMGFFVKNLTIAKKVVSLQWQSKQWLCKTRKGVPQRFPVMIVPPRV